MTADSHDPAVRPLARTGMGSVTRAFVGGIVLGLIVGAALGFVVASNVKPQAKWTDANGVFVRLPENTALGGALPQTLSLPGSSYDFGGVGEPLPPAIVEAGSIVKVEVQAVAGRVGVSLARPDGGELLSREAVVTPQQGKTSLYFRTAPGMGAVDVLLRSADNVAAGASATVSKVQSTREADIGQGEMSKISRAGLY